jgi:thiol-disulfide isomerase/thioredoxin
LRVIAATLTLGIGALALWQAGLLAPAESSIETAGASLAAANADVQTPAVAGLSVGLSEGNLAPDFEFSAFDGRRLRLSEARGRPVLINFWATWCGPCRVELPDIEQLQRRHEDAGFTVYAINNGERFAPASRFLSRMDVQLSAFGYDLGQAIARRYGVAGLPMSYFIDARGVIVKVVAGQLTRTLMEAGAQAAMATP